MIRPTDKIEIRLRIPRWIAAQLEIAATESGITKKPMVASAAQILDDWAREREAKMEDSKNGHRTASEF